MYSILHLLLLAAIVNANSLAELRDKWQHFKREHAKKYESEVEDGLRFRIFQENKILIDRHNQLYESGRSSFQLGLNSYADLLSHEIVQRLCGYNSSSEINRSDNPTFTTPQNVEIPLSIDWRQRGVVTPIKNQGNCGSCWSFAATGALEAQHKLKTNQLISLSEQNLVDCSGGKYGNHGCSGGRPDKAFNYIKENAGVDTESSYPYLGREGQCRFNRRSVGATARGFIAVPHGNEAKLRDAVGTVGPVTVAIDALKSSFHFYKSGIYDDSACSSTSLNHAVLVVGYGTERGLDYWLVKNSWGTSWGNNGYVQIARNKNRCGIANDGVYPLV